MKAGENRRSIFRWASLRTDRKQKHKNISSADAPPVKRYAVHIPPIVQDQIRSQVFQIASHSIENALKWEARLHREIKSLSAMPSRHAVDEGASVRVGQGVRKFVFERTYLVFYRIREDERAVDILNFRHGATLPAPNEA